MRLKKLAVSLWGVSRTIVSGKGYIIGFVFYIINKIGVVAQVF